MKLAKVSLAAVVALGTLSTASMAKDLSEAIKGVDVSGFLRYRFNDLSTKNAGFVKDNNHNGSDVPGLGTAYPTTGGAETEHEWKAVANFTIPTSETFSAVIGVEYNNDTETGASTNAALGRAATPNNAGIQEEGIAVRQFYGAWNPNGTKTTVHIGKFNLATPATDPGYDRGTGILALNSDVENVTFAAAALDTWYVDNVVSTSVLNTLGVTSNDNRENNLYALAAIAGFGGFSGQLWAFNIEDMVDSLIVAQLGYEYDMFGIEGQYFNNQLNTTDATNLSTRDGKGKIFPNTVNDSYQLWTVQGSIDWNILGATAGYLGSGENGYFVQLTDQASFINYGGEQWYGDGFGATGLGSNGMSLSMKDGGKNELEVWWLTAMVDTTWNNISVGADYVQSENNTVAGTGAQEVNYDGEEWVGRVNWKASDAWNVKTYYSNFKNKMKANTKPANYADVEMDKFRVEARYNF